MRLSTMMTRMLTAALVATGACGCSAKSAETADAQGADGGDDATEVSVPVFDADTAYAYVAAQTAMGPRTPGSAANRQCRDWIAGRLRAAGADTVLVQSATVTGPEGKPLAIGNVLGRFGADRQRRVLVLAHYDTRPWADADTDAANHKRAIDGANDGASGVAVILELARQLAVQRPEVGVDLLLVDAEDSGTEADDMSWCLGTQYFVKNMPYGPADKPAQAILLDMVGGRGAVFKHEYFGYQSAPQLAQAVWRSAQATGNGQRFVDEMGGAVNDDHVHLIGAGIPTIDIIEIGHPQTGSFNPTWHTLNDNLGNIDRSTLGAVGQTVMHFIYNN